MKMITLNSNGQLDNFGLPLTMPERLDLAHRVSVSHFYAHPAPNQGPVLLCVEVLSGDPAEHEVASGFAVRAVQNGQAIATFAAVSEGMVEEDEEIQTQLEGVTWVRQASLHIFFNDFLLHLYHRIAQACLPQRLQSSQIMDIRELVHHGHLLPLHAGRCQFFYEMLAEWDVTQWDIPYDDLDEQFNFGTFSNLSWLNLSNALLLNGLQPNLLKLDGICQLPGRTGTLLNSVERLESLATALHRQEPWLQAYRLPKV